MSEAQRRLYWREWRAAAQILEQSQGLDRAALEDYRKQLHQDTLGKPCSSKDIIGHNKRLDAILATFRAISRPDDLESQLRQQRQNQTRIIWRIDRDLEEMGKDRRYCAGILQRMSSEGKIPLHAALEDYRFPDLQKIATAVRRTLYAHRKRHAHQAGE